MIDTGARSETKGIGFVVVSYIIWGLFPLYWRLLDGVPPAEIALHRIVWCAALAGLIALGRHRLTTLWRILRTPRLIGALLISGLLVTGDWTCYIYGVATRRLVEISLGLFVTPLFSIFLGVAVLGERVSRRRAWAIGLGVAALLVQVVAFGRIPWIALGIAGCFGGYGYVRKKIPVDPLDGLFVETAVLTPLAAIILAILAIRGVGAFRAAAPKTDLWLVLSGVVTAVPLALFVAGARVIRLSTVGLVQYFSPGLTLALAIFGFGERFSPVDAAAFVCLWGALLLVSLEGRRARA